MTRTCRFTVHEDGRGALLPVELDDVDFPVRRIFVVSAPEGGADRGGHEVSCGELVVLVGGRAQIEVRGTSGSETVRLEAPGDGVRLVAGEYMAYRLADSSSILVLAEEPFADTDRPAPP